MVIFNIFALVVKLLLVPVTVTVKGLIVYVQLNLTPFKRQLIGRPREFVAGVNSVGIVKIIFDPFKTVPLLSGVKVTRRCPKYPAVMARVEVLKEGMVKLLKTVRFVLVRGVMAKGTFNAWSTRFPFP